ncbi:mechanosensitive ion channel [Roseovarius aestuarii]|nr:mechanosensitive ion channel [Roseovarius aestuarii]
MDAIFSELSVFAPLIINAVKALIVLIIGWAVAGFVGRLARRQVNTHPRLDKTLGHFAATVVTWIIRLMVLVAVLGLFGIQATSLVAVMGAATLAIGMALQGTLAGLAAGIMLVIFRPYSLGQYVNIGGTEGTVTEISLFFTELTTPQNVQIIVPNGEAWGSIITNYSAHDTRRLDLTFGIDYGDNADLAMQIMLDHARNEPRIMSDPEPWARVTNLGDSAVDVTARLWCRNEDFWDLKFSLTKAIKETFDAQGISIPYPYRTVVTKQG